MITFPLFSGHQYLEIALTLCTTQHKMCFRTRNQQEQSLQPHLKMSTALELFFNQPTQFLLPCLTMSSTLEIFVALCHCFNDSFTPKNIRRGLNNQKCKQYWLIRLKLTPLSISSGHINRLLRPQNTWFEERKFKGKSFVFINPDTDKSTALNLCGALATSMMPPSCWPPA